MFDVFWRSWRRARPLLWLAGVAGVAVLSLAVRQYSKQAH